MDALVRADFMITRSQKKRLRQLAARDEVSMAFFVRRAIEHYLTVAAGPTANQLRSRMLAAVGSLPVEPAPPIDDGPVLYR